MPLLNFSQDTTPLQETELKQPVAEVTPSSPIPRDLVHEMLIKDIVVLPSRARRNFSKVPSLMESILQVGLIEPIVLNSSANGGKPELIAGESRYRACLMIAATKKDQLPITHPAYNISRGLVTVVLKNELPPLIAKKIELEENVCRKDLDWPEQIALLAQIDVINKQLNPLWKQEDTARLVSQDKGYVSTQIKFAGAMTKVTPQEKAQLERLPLSAALRVHEQNREREKVERLHAQGSIVLKSELKCGGCLDLIKELPDESVSLWLTDMPFANEGIQAGVGKVASVSDEGKSMSFMATLSKDDNSTIEEMTVLMQQLRTELYRVLKPGAHFYLFFGWDMYEVLYRMFSSGGFTVLRAPLIWNKKRQVTAFHGKNYPSMYEPILTGWKGTPEQGRRLNENGLGNVIECPPITTKVKLHPFEKPTELLTKLIKVSTNIGDTVLDTFAGSGSTIEAAESCGRQGIGFELNAERHMMSQVRFARMKVEKGGM